MELIILVAVLILAVATVDFCPVSTYEDDTADTNYKI